MGKKRGNYPRQRICEVDMERARLLVQALNQLGIHSLPDNERYWQAIQILEQTFEAIAQHERAKALKELQKQGVRVS